MGMASPQPQPQPQAPRSPAPGTHFPHRGLPDDFPQRGEVGSDAKVFLRAAVRDAEPRHHLVEHQQSAAG